MKRRMKNRLGRPVPPPPEFGDWRMPTDRPDEDEHLPALTPNLWHRLQLRADYWQEAEVELEPPIIPISGLARAVRLALSLFVLIPLSIVMVFGLLEQLLHAPSVVETRFWLSVPVWYTLIGLGVFASLMTACVRVTERLLICIYVLGHESTHAVAALLSLGKINAFRFDEFGGYVETDADNVFVALSPYFVPFWMLVWMLALWLINLCFPLGSAYEPWFYAGLGFWWAFHLYWTFWVIPREQPDMLENGLLFSVLVVMLMNIGVLLVVLWCFGVLTPQSYWASCVECAYRILDMLNFVGNWLLSLVG